MIRKILARGGCAWSTSEANSSIGNRNFDDDDDDDVFPISSCWLHFYESATGRELEVASLSWSTST